MSWFLSFVFLGDVVLQINCSSLLPWQLLLGTFWKRLKVRWSYLVKAKPEAWKIPKQRLRNAIWYDVLKNFFFSSKFRLFQIWLHHMLLCEKNGFPTFPVWDLNVRTLPTLRAARRHLRHGWRVLRPQLPDAAAYLCGTCKYPLP